MKRFILPLLLLAFAVPLTGCVVQGPGYHCGFWHRCR